MRLILIRHGQTPANVLGQLDTGRPGPGLTELGEQQAAAIPGALDGQPVDALFASPLVRTQLTAEPLSAARDLPVEVRDGLHEVEAGSLEMRRDRASVRTYLETIIAWGGGDRDRSMPGGPDGHEFFGRFDGAIADIETAGFDTATVVSHGAAIRLWTAATAQNVAPQFAADHELDNTGIVVLHGSFAEGWVLTEWAGEPIGGAELVDTAADDVLGEPMTEAIRA